MFKKFQHRIVQISLKIPISPKESQCSVISWFTNRVYSEVQLKAGFANSDDIVVSVHPLWQNIKFTIQLNKPTTEGCRFNLKIFNKAKGN